jgi:putative FmdB family regulatory protein
LPNYEYICQDCEKAFTIFQTFQEYGKRKVSCPICHGHHVRRRISRVRVMRSEDSHMEEMTDGGNLDGLEEDPQAMGKMLRKMRSQVGEEVPPEYDEVVDRLEAGQTPQDIESDMPDLAAGMDGGMAAPMGAGGSDDDLD